MYIYIYIYICCNHVVFSADPPSWFCLRLSSCQHTSKQQGDVAVQYRVNTVPKNLMLRPKYYGPLPSPPTKTFGLA